jgi:hypothetical protein
VESVFALYHYGCSSASWLGIQPFFYGLLRQTGAACKAAALEDVFAGLASHAFEEAVFFGALTLLWLKSSFGHNLFYYTCF